MTQTEKVIYTHKCQNSMAEWVATEDKNFDISAIEATAFGRSYKSAVRRLNALPFSVRDIWADDDE